MNKSKNTIQSRLALVVLAQLLTWGADCQSATRFVEKWGDDANAPDCRRTNPCATIGTALDASGNNDRITIGPGTFTQPTLDIDKTGIQIYSVAGRHATTIASEDGMHSIRISAEKVKIGKTGKGFTITGAWRGGYYSAGVFTHGQAGIHVDAGAKGGVKIEGNRFGSPRKPGTPQDNGFSTNMALEDDGFENFYGLRVQNGGNRVQIRKNLFQNNRYRAIFCNNCDRALIKDNRIQSNGSRDQFVGSTPSFVRNGGLFLGGSADRTSVIDNIVTSDSNSQGGIYLWIEGGNVKAVNNVSGNNLSYHGGIHVHARDWLKVSIEKNIAFRNSGDGIKLSTGSRSAPGTIAGNLSVDSSRDGIHVYGNEQPKIQSNLSLASGINGFAIYGRQGSFKRNGSIGSHYCSLNVHYQFLAQRFYTTLNNQSGFCGSEDLVTSIKPSKSPPRLYINKSARIVGG